METRILEASLAKLCSLLAVGFGDAGGEVIGNNIKSGGDLNPMIPGHKILGIYGFCDIRQFTDATEVLQVMAVDLPLNGFRRATKARIGVKQNICVTTIVSKTK